MYNSFPEQLKESLNEEFSNKLNSKYRAMVLKNVWKFDDIISDIETVNDLEEQFKGRDKILKFKEGSIIKLEEKIREEYYDDFLGEEISNCTTGTPGWLIDNKKDTDILSYISNYIYWYHFKKLRMWFQENYEKYPIIMATTKSNVNRQTYQTQNRAIPYEDIKQFIVCKSDKIRNLPKGNEIVKDTVKLNKLYKELQNEQYKNSI